MTQKTENHLCGKMSGNQRKKLQKLGQISPEFSREIQDTLRSKFKYS